MGNEHCNCHQQKEPDCFQGSLGRIPIPPQVGVGGCGVFDYLECAALIAAAGTACVLTRSAGFCLQAVGAAVAAGCWDCLSGETQELACLFCRQNPGLCPVGIRARCRFGAEDASGCEENKKHRCNCKSDWSGSDDCVERKRRKH